MDAEEVPVRGVGVSLLMRIKRDDDGNESQRFCNPVKFFHHIEEVVEMLDNIVADNLVEVIVGKGVRKPVEIVNDVGLRARIHIDADRTWMFAKATAKVENVECLNGWGGWLFAVNL
jgi:hypothetical protein